jgi:VanZ family protein
MGPMPGLRTRPVPWWIALGAYLALVFVVSTRPYLQSPVQFPMWDKLAHLVEYAVLGLLLQRALRRTGRASAGRLGSVRVLVLVLIGLGIGILDETVQARIPGRQSTWTDLVADGIGLLVGQGIERWLDRWGRRRSSTEASA